MTGPAGYHQGLFSRLITRPPRSRRVSSCVFFGWSPFRWSCWRAPCRGVRCGVSTDFEAALQHPGAAAWGERDAGRSGAVVGNDARGAGGRGVLPLPARRGSRGANGAGRFRHAADAAVADAQPAVRADRRPAGSAPRHRRGPGRPGVVPRGVTAAVGPAVARHPQRGGVGAATDARRPSSGGATSATPASCPAKRCSGSSRRSPPTRTACWCRCGCHIRRSSTTGCWRTCGGGGSGRTRSADAGPRSGRWSRSAARPRGGRCGWCGSAR